MQQVLQDPSHTGAALQLYEQLKNCFPKVSSNFIVAVVTEVNKRGFFRSLIAKLLGAILILAWS